jgi:ABC-type Mn2+/Zn2+ transport system permease subunit
MKLDAELDLWREQWQASSEAPILTGLRKRVARQSLYMRIMVAADILVTVVIGGGTISLAIRNPRIATAILAAATWLFITVAWIFGLSNRKDTWSPAASTMSAFLDLSIRRCRGNLRATTFGAILYVVEMAFCISWVHHESGFFSSTLITVVGLVTLIFAALLIIYRKKKRADLSYLSNLQRDLTTAE